MRIIASTLGLATLCALGACTWSGSDSPTQSAIRRGLQYLEPAAAQQPYALAFGYFLRRRFGIDEFADAPARYQAIIASAVHAEDPKRRTLPNPGALRLFGRLIDPGVRYDDSAIVEAEGPLDLTTIAALYCNQRPLSEGYAAQLRKEANAGHYRLTHAVMAVAWLRDNDCDVPVSKTDLDEWLGRLASLAGSLPTHDVGLEAAALLAYFGEADRLPPDHCATVLAAQQPDGGWRPCDAPPCDPPTGLRPETATSHWHPSALALWLLLETSTDGPLDPFVPSDRPAT